VICSLVMLYTKVSTLCSYTCAQALMVHHGGLNFVGMHYGNWSRVMDGSCTLMHHANHCFPMLLGILDEFLTINVDDKFPTVC
jgi:hypothetical protein